MFISFTSGKTDNKISFVEEFSWPQVVEFFASGHELVESKDTIIFSPWKFEDKNGEGFIRRCADNATKTQLMVLDFDGSVSIPEAKEKLKAYKHLGYTSFSHRIKNGSDCFRVLLPIKEEFTPDSWLKKRTSMRKLFRGADPSSFDVARGFYVPSCSKDNEVLAEHWVNDGVLFDVSILEDEKEVEFTYDNELEDDEMQELLSKLKSHYLGYEPAWYRVGLAMVTAGFSVSDFVDATVNGLMKQKTVNDAKTKWERCVRDVERGKTVSVGYLYNIINGKHK